MGVIKCCLKKHNNISFYQTYKVNLIKYDDEGNQEDKPAWFDSNTRRILNSENMEQKYDESVNQINDNFGRDMGEQSGWTLDKIENVWVNISSYNPIRGSCHIPTPSRLFGKQAIINVKNYYSNCFLYAVCASEYPVKNNQNRVFNYDIEKLKRKGIELPMRLKNIDKFKRNE